MKKHTEHNHPPSQKEVIKSSIVSTVMYDTTTATPGNFLRDALAVAPPDVKAILPSGYLLKKQVMLFSFENIVISWVFATWVFRASGRQYPTLELELGIDYR